MLSDLAEAVESLDIPLHGEGIAAALKLRDLLDAKITKVVGDYDAAGLHEVDGAVSITGWLKQHSGLTAGGAASLARHAKRMRQLPVMAKAWLDGDLTGGQVAAIVANVDDATISLLQEHEADLIPMLVPLPVNHTADVMRLWKARADAQVDRPAPAERSSTAHLSETLDGRGRLDADLDPEGLATLRAALRLAESPDCECDEPRTPGERRGEALIDIARHYLDNLGEKPKHRNRPHLNLVADADRFREAGGEFVDGGYADATTLARLFCDSDVHRVVTQGRSVILDFGMAARFFSDAQYNAIALRDRHCRVFGCDRPASACAVHHVIEFDDGGPTALWNGVLKCRRHHQLGHRPGWTEKLEPDGTYHLTAPDGRTWTTYPPGVTPPII